MARTCVDEEVSVHLAHPLRLSAAQSLLSRHLEAWTEVRASQLTSHVLRCIPSQDQVLWRHTLIGGALLPPPLRPVIADNLPGNPQLRIPALYEDWRQPRRCLTPVLCSDAPNLRSGPFCRRVFSSISRLRRTLRTPQSPASSLAPSSLDCYDRRPREVKNADDQCRCSKFRRSSKLTARCSPSTVKVAPNPEHWP